MGRKVLLIADLENRIHECLNSILKGVKGRFLLSYNDDDYVRTISIGILKSSKSDPSSNLAMRYSNRPKRYNELLISNY